VPQYLQEAAVDGLVRPLVRTQDEQGVLVKRLLVGEVMGLELQREQERGLGANGGAAPRAAVLGHLVGAASYVGGDRAGVTGQVEGDLLAVAFGERVRAGPRRGRQERAPGCRP